VPSPTALYGADFTFITVHVDVSGMPPGMPADDHVAVPPAGRRLVGRGEAHSDADVRATTTARMNAPAEDAWQVPFVFMSEVFSLEPIGGCRFNAQSYPYQ